jgi:hypothetical protein
MRLIINGAFDSYWEYNMSTGQIFIARMDTENESRAEGGALLTY